MRFKLKELVWFVLIHEVSEEESASHLVAAEPQLMRKHPMT